MKSIYLLFCILFISQLGNAQIFKKTRLSDRRVIADYSQRIDDLNGNPQSFSDSNNYVYSLSRGSKWISIQTQFNNKFVLGEKPKLENLSNKVDTRINYGGFDFSSNIPTLYPYIKWVNTYNANNNVTNGYVLKWNSASSTWDSTDKFVKDYDANNNLISVTSYKWNSNTSNWDNIYRDYYSYNANNILTKEINLKWSTITSNMDTLITHELTFIGTNLNSDLTVYYYNGVKNGGTLISYVYDTNNNLTEKTTKFLNPSTLNYDNNEKISYSYSPNSIISITQYWNMSTNTYINNDKFEMNTINGNIFKDGRDYYWYDSINNWSSIPSEMDTATYDANNKLSKLVIHNGTVATIVAIEIFRDAQGKITQYNENETTKSEYTYDNYNNIINVKNYDFNTTTHSWDYNENEERYYYETYDNALGTNNLTVLKNNSLFPNPCTTNCYLSFFTSSNIETTINVCDIFGRTVYSINENVSIGDHLVKLPFENLVNGIYVVNIYSKGKLLSSQKAIKN